MSGLRNYITQEMTLDGHECLSKSEEILKYIGFIKILNILKITKYKMFEVWCWLWKASVSQVLGGSRNQLSDISEFQRGRDLILIHRSTLRY